MIKQKLALLVAALALAASVTTSQAVLSLNFAGVVGSSIQFGGAASNFQLTPAPGSVGSPQFVINNTTGGTGSANGLFGWINGGPWSIGAVTVNGSVQTASVSGTGSLFIRDGSGVNLTGTINWVAIQTINSIGGVNADLTVNLTGMSYSGLNADLLTLANGKNGSVNLSFQFNPGQTLSQLTTGTSQSTSFSGSITAIPEPSTVVAGALLLLPFGVSTIRILRKNRVS
jgi:hypothetical protein